METIANIFVSSADFIVDKKTLAKANLPAFKSARIIKATVLKSLSAKQVQLSIFGQKITAKTHVPLKPGDVLFLKAVKSGNQQVLKLMELQPQSQGSPLQPRLGFSNALGRSGLFEPLIQLFDYLEKNAAPDSAQKPAGQPEGLRPIKQLLSRMALKSDAPEPAIVKKFITHSGLTLEEKVADLLAADKQVIEKSLRDISQNDLKAMVLKLAAKNEKEEPARLIKMFMEGLENYQLLNKQAFKDLGRYLIPFPVLFDNGFKFGQLYMDLGRQKSSHTEPDKQLVKVAVLLELSQMGDMLADFSILKKAVNGTFRVGDQDAYTLIQAHIPALKKRLNVHGFTVHQISCQLVTPRELAETTLADRMLENETGGLNLIV